MTIETVIFGNRADTQEKTTVRSHNQHGSLWDFPLILTRLLLGVNVLQPTAFVLTKATNPTLAFSKLGLTVHRSFRTCPDRKNTPKP